MWFATCITDDIILRVEKGRGETRNAGLVDPGMQNSQMICFLFSPSPTTPRVLDTENHEKTPWVRPPGRVYDRRVVPRLARRCLAGAHPRRHHPGLGEFGACPCAALAPWHVAVY